MLTILKTVGGILLKGFIERITKTQERKERLIDKKYDYKESLLESKSFTNLDSQSILNNRFSWADEIFKVIVISPFVMAFIPMTQTSVKEGFQIIDNDMPYWLVAMIVLIGIDQFGMRGMIMNGAEKIKEFFNLKKK